MRRQEEDMTHPVWCEPDRCHAGLEGPHVSEQSVLNDSAATVTLQLRQCPDHAPQVGVVMSARGLWVCVNLGVEVAHRLGGDLLRMAAAGRADASSEAWP